MSTTPTLLSETTAATEELLDVESIKALLDGIDPAALLPDLSKVFDSLVPLCRIAVLVGPIVLLILGLVYLLLSPKEANHYLGYRCYYGMGSVDAWRFTQRLAGIVFGVLGLVLTGVMLVLAGTFAGMNAMDMVWRALKCLIAEGVLALAANIAVGCAAMIRFDRRGEYRKK